MEEIFREDYFHAADMWQLIEDGIKRRNPERDIYFEKARKMLQKYVELRDDEKFELQCGLERYRVVLRESRARVKELENQVADLAERLDEEHEEEI